MIVVTDCLVSRSYGPSNCGDGFQLISNPFALLPESETYLHAPTNLLDNRPRIRSTSADVPLIRYLARKIGIFIASTRADFDSLEHSSISPRGQSLA